MRRTLLVLTVAVVALLLPLGCGTSSSSVRTIVDLETAKSQTFADVSTSWQNQMNAIKASAPADGPTAKTIAKAEVYLTRKNDQYARLSRDTVRAVNASKAMTAADRERFTEDAFRVIDRIQGRPSPPPE